MQHICGTLAGKKIREHSYANLLYSEVRSPYTHEFKSGQRADSWPMTRRENVAISYGNWTDAPQKHIHFHIDWISELAISVAQAVDKAAAQLPPKPQRWWVHG